MDTLRILIALFQLQRQTLNNVNLWWCACMCIFCVPVCGGVWEWLYFWNTLLWAAQYVCAAGTMSSQQATLPLPTWVPIVTYMWGRCFHMPLPICLLGFVNRMETLRGTAKPEPLLSVGPRTPALVVFGTTRVIHALLSTLGAAHAPKGYFSWASHLRKAKRPWKETVENLEAGT